MTGPNSLSVPNGGPTESNERTSLLIGTGRAAAPPSLETASTTSSAGGGGMRTQETLPTSTGNAASAPLSPARSPVRRASASGVSSGTSGAIKLVTKQNRPRKSVAQFRKKGRHWSSTWTGRLGVHVKVNEIDIAALSIAIENKLPGWKAVDHYDVMRMWQTELPYVGVENSADWPVSDEDASGVPATATAEGASVTVDSETAIGAPPLTHDATRPQVFIFSFGAVVFWNFPNAKFEEQWLDDNILGPFADTCGTPHSKEEVEYASDDMEFSYGKSFGIKRDVVELATREAGEKLAVSFALAKSSMLSIYESRVQETIERNSHIPEEMAKNGRLHMSRTDITKEVGRMFLVKHGINLDQSLMDTPEEFWEDDRFEGVYDWTLKYLQITKRHELVNNRLDMIGELHQVLIEENQTHHSVFLEWIVILLIVVEVMLDLMHLSIF